MQSANDCGSVLQADKILAYASDPPFYTDGTLVKWSQYCEDGWSDVSGNLAVECADDIKDKEAMCRPLSEEEKKKNTSGYIFIGVFTVIGTAIWFGVAHLCKKRQEKKGQEAGSDG